ncbi:MAG: putative phosphatase regulatory subunit-domain-containing protein [Linnemannia gamsii]|nr:MAG: putative phosphatase regulatory subunit-domain-containing protein [Linnemannia gamsii]
MSLSTSPADLSPQPFVLSSPDRVVFRTIPHPIASSNKRVTLSLRRTSPSTNNNTTQIPVNTQSPNTPRHSTTMNTTDSAPSSPAQPLGATTKPTNSAPASTNLTTIVTPPSPIRKQCVLIGKNGLPIKSALKSPVTPSPSSTGQVRPSTIRSHTSSPLTCPKYVHFNSQLEHVRLFLQGETPSCVGDRDTIVDPRQNSESTSDIKLTLTNWSPVPAGTFQPGNIDAGAAPLRVETMALSQDHSELQGKILIHNIAFHKRVSVRYTTDYWQTQTEVNAEFEESIPGSSLDRFAFKIPMEMDKTKVERSFCFAVRYQVIGREFWDSNNGMNYQVECKRVVVVAPPATSDLSKQMNSILLASRMPDYGKPLLKKKPANNRYDLSTSLSAAYSQPMGSPTWGKRDPTPIAQTAYRPSEYITPVQSPPGYHHSLYASSPKFVNSYLSAASPPEHFHIGFDQLSLDRSIPVKKQPSSRKSWGGRDQETGSASSPSSTSPISIPSAQAHTMGSSGYYDLVDRYCFYESSPHSSPYTSPYSSYPNSPPAPCIRG